MFRLVLAEGRSLVRQGNEIEARAVEVLSDHPNYHPRDRPDQRLDHLDRSWRFTPFHHNCQFLKFCGMDLATVQSGMFLGHRRISKFGNARLHRTLRMACQVAVLKRTNSFRDTFERYIARDRHNAYLRHKTYTAIAATLS